MRIEFVKEEYTRDDVPIAYFDVSEDLTKEECEAIYDYIFEEQEDWERRWEESEDCDEEFDYWTVCYDACKKIIPQKLIENSTTKTFYI